MRICPECGSRTEEPVCPEDGLPTIAEHLLRGESDTPELVHRSIADRYDVDALVGRGGMGWVFRAHHRFTGQTLAVKVMRQEVTHDREAVRRFFREARACTRLKHHHTIKVHDFGLSDDGFPYIVMEYLDGRSLADLLAEAGPLPPARAAHIATQICKSLDEAHELGLVHRDLKPSNVFLTAMHGEQDYVKVLDFGIAKFVGDVSESTITVSGVVIGTPRYLSPEQAQAGPLDRRSDLYSLGVLLYEMLSGELPFAARNLQTLLVMHVQERPPPLPDVVGGRPIPDALRQLVMRLLEKRPDDRPATAADVVAILSDAVGSGPTGQAGPRSAASSPTAARPRDPVAAGSDTDISAAVPRRPWRTAAAIAVGAVAVLAFLGAVLLFGRDGGPVDDGRGAGGREDGAGGVAAVLDVGPPVGTGTPPSDAPPVPMAVPAGAPDSFSPPTVRAGGDAARTVGVASAEVRPGGARDTTAEVDATAAVDTNAEAEPPAAPASVAAARTVALRSEPNGAAVWEGDAELGRTPLELSLEPGRSRSLRFTLEGHRSVRRTVDDETGAELLVRLRARRQRPLPTADGAPTSGEPSEPTRIRVPTDF